MLPDASKCNLFTAIYIKYKIQMPGQIYKTFIYTITGECCEPALVQNELKTRLAFVLTNFCSVVYSVCTVCNVNCHSFGVRRPPAPWHVPLYGVTRDSLGVAYTV